MNKTIKIGTVSIPLESYVTTGTALLGTKGAGKTYAAKGIAEQLLDHGIAPIIFDPIGRWRYMKIAGDDSKRPKGYKLVVAGGEQPDLPLTPASAPEIVRAAMRENIPLVLDLLDRRLSKADWRRIVQTCFRTLLFENKGLRHVFLEEAAEFVPQKVFDGETYAEVEKLVRMGGNVSLGITLLNQRSQEVNKAVLDLCDNLVLMRQRGSHAIDALEKWIDRLDPAQAKAITAGMPHMKAGEAWVFAGSAENAMHVQTSPIRSFHPDRSKPDLTAAAEASRRTDPADFVARLSGELEELMRAAEASDPKRLRARIAELERQLKGTGALRPEQTRSAQDTGYRRGIEDGRQEGYRRGVAETMAGVRRWRKDVIRSMQQAVESELSHEPTGIGLDWDGTAKGFKPSRPMQVGDKVRMPNGSVEQVAAAGPVPTRLKPGKEPGANGAATVEKAMPRAMLTALAQHPDGLTKRQILIHTGYRASGPVSSCFADLVREGWVGANGNRLTITDTGLQALGPFDPLPTGEALREHLLAGDKCSTMEKAMLRVLFEAYPDPVTKGRILEEAGYKASGPVSSAFARLVALGYAEQSGRSELRASEDLFR